MKTSMCLKFFGLLSILCLAGEVSADGVPDFSNYLDQKLVQLETALCSVTDPGSGAAQFSIQDMNVDFTTSVSFGVKSALSLSINPEIDLVLVPRP